MGNSLLIVNGRIIDPAQDRDMTGDVFIDEGRIKWVRESREGNPRPGDCQLLDATGLAVCPGFVDLHCHLREPGYEHKETIYTGTRAAAKGGFTTVCAMPNTNPPMDTRATIDYVKQKALEEGAVKVLPIGCVTKGSGGQEMAELMELAEAGAIGFSDDGRPVFDSNIMRQALTYVRYLGLPIIDHCEDPALFQDGVMNEGRVSTILGLRGVPSIAEESMVARDIQLAALTGGALHLAHVSTEGSVEMVRRAKANGIQVTCEATPHHLTLDEEWVLGRNGADSPLSMAFAYDTHTKVNPPLRHKRDVEAMVRALKEGVIDVIATDHAPHSQVDKVCTYQEAAFGISNFETALASVLTLVHRGRIDIVTVIRCMTSGPARILRRDDVGTLKEGAPADVTIFDPNADWTVDAEEFISKGKNTPLDGVKLKGKVVATLVDGRLAYRDDKTKLTADGTA